MKSLATVLFALLLIAGLVHADIYMHNPRGSNNRNCERNDNRNNANLLFDSQNNAAGGYACPRSVGGPETPTQKMYYYVGSILHIEWASQHSCGMGNAHCQIILQYMCGPNVRSGVPSGPNDDATDTIDQTTDNNPRYGRHESMTSYIKCATRRRNNGLFAADQIQNVNNGLKAIITRQDNSGTRHGWECPEERDYYPYWHPTEWKDIAIITSNTSMCKWYQQNSQNVVDKGECYDLATGTKYLEYNNPQDCKGNNGKWIMNGSWGIAPPDCLGTDKIIVRDNHLGNTLNGQLASYDWVIPNDPNPNCVLRIRYNISTADFDPWLTDYTYNLEASPIANRYRNADWGTGSWLALKINTDQYFRTFQDRSYVFEIRSRPNNVPQNARIWNLNVRGKRGNIVETYPSTEYDFVPTNLVVQGGDYIHFQWDGSDYNPNRQPNDAEGGPEDPAQPGNYRADRHNLVQIDIQGANMPRPAQYNTMFRNDDGTPDMKTITSFAHLNQAINGTALSQDPKIACLPSHIIAGQQFHSQNCGKLNGQKVPYFDGGLVQMKASGTFHYMCTRNNNFSNRSQKGSITVIGGWFAAASMNSVSIISLIALMIIAYLAPKMF